MEAGKVSHLITSAYTSKEKVALERELMARMSGAYCCRNDLCLTLKSDAAELSGLVGYSAEEIQSVFHNSLLELTSEEERKQLRQALSEQLSAGDDVELVYSVYHKEGSVIWVLNRGHRMIGEDGQEYLNGLLVDITQSKQIYDEQKKATSALQEQAERDSLTKLFNAHTVRRLTEEYFSGLAGKGNCALLIIDLDNFKQVNDRYGHMLGDAVLTQAAQTICKLFRSHDIVGRIGGDEFLVLMKAVSDRELVNKRCSQLLDAFHEAFQHQLCDLELSCSIGVAFSPAHGTLYYDLFRCADQALYQAKKLGKNQYTFYDSEDRDFSKAGMPQTTILTKEREENTANFQESGFLLYVFQQLYEAENVETTVYEMLDMLGRQKDISRVYVMEWDLEKEVYRSTFEWCNADVSPAGDSLQNLCGKETLKQFEKCFDEQGIFCCQDIQGLPVSLRGNFEQRKVKSALFFTIRDAGWNGGYIGFEECVTSCPWTREQVNTLWTFTKIISVFLAKERAEQRKE